jgi:hypothetical protein
LLSVKKKKQLFGQSIARKNFKKNIENCNAFSSEEISLPKCLKISSLNQREGAKG